MNKATVRAVRFGDQAETASGFEYSAHHKACGWFENRTYWYSAFWAADHHMRYDCGRRSPSSGGYDTRQWTSTTGQMRGVYVRTPPLPSPCTRPGGGGPCHRGGA